MTDAQASQPYIPATRATRSGMTWLYGSLLAVIVLMAYEVTYYLRETDFGNIDDFSVAWEGYHPQCTPSSGHVLDMTCPLPAYNKINLECWSSVCSYRDPNSPPMTEALRTQRRHQLLKDAQDSYAVEPPTTANDRAFAMRGEIDEDLSLPAQTMPQALDQMHKRDLRVFQQRLRAMEGR